MCGICGELSFDRRRPVSAEAVRSMRDQLVHRGPDAFGIHVSPDGVAGLGFRRLKIIDLSPERQPADAQRGRQHPAGVQRRNLQLPADSRTPGRGGTPVPIALRHGSHRPSVRREGRRVRRGARRDVRARHLGRPAAAAGARARPRRQEAALLLSRRPPAGVRLGDQGVSRPSRHRARQSTRRSLPYYFLYGYVPGPDTFYRARHRRSNPARSSPSPPTARSTHRVYWKPGFPDAAAQPAVGHRPPRGDGDGPVAHDAGGRAASR